MLLLAYLFGVYPVNESTALAVTVPSSPAAALMGFDTSMLAGQVAPSSMRMYAQDFAAYLRFAGYSAELALQPATFARWRAELATATTKAPGTINRMLAGVKRVIAEASLQGYIPANLAAEFAQVGGVKVAALKDRQRKNARTRISPDDMRRLCMAPDGATLAGQMHRALLATLASSGLRVSEAVTLTTGQIEHGVDDEGRPGWSVLVMGKNETEPSRRPLSMEAQAAIARWLEARSAAGVEVATIFTGFTGRGSRGLRSEPIRPSSAWEIVQRYAAAVGLAHIKPHDFRRFVGTQLARKDLRLAQKALGHKRIETTAKHYVLDGLQLGQTDNLY
jgi:integrase/recombinase XerD